MERDDSERLRGFDNGRTDIQHMDICDSRVVFAIENLEKNRKFEKILKIEISKVKKI